MSFPPSDQPTNDTTATSKFPGAPAPQVPWPDAPTPPAMPKKPFYKRWWFIAIVIVVALSILGSLVGGEDSAPTSTADVSADAAGSSSESAATPATVPDVVGKKAHVAILDLTDAGFTTAPDLQDQAGAEVVINPANWTVVSQEPAAGTELSSDTTITLVVTHDADDAAGSSTDASGDSTTDATPNVPVEYLNALSKAESYSDLMRMSKQGIYDQLTSEYGEQFSPEAAQYAIDNIQADWAANALAKAKVYQETMAMSPAAIHDQLISEYGEKFTPEEADYAIAHLND